MSEIDDFLDGLKNKTEEDIHKTAEESIDNNETIFSEEDKQRLIDDQIEKATKRRIRLRRREKNMIKNQEYDSTSGTLKDIVLGLAVIGIILIFALQHVFENDALYYMIIMIGSIMFFPIGMIAGWMVFDPVMRCKILRRLTKRNYGVVNFVGSGNKSVQKIKNFDEGLVWRNKECWVIAKDRVVQLSKNGNAITKGKEIDPKSILTLVDTVPILFVDLNSFEPLTFYKEGRSPVQPGEIGPSLKAWVDNQRAKMMAAHKAMDTMFLVIIICSAGALITSYMAMQKVDDLTSTVNGIKGQVKTILDILQQNPP